MSSDAPTTEIFVNDQRRVWVEGAVLAVLLAELGLAERRGIAAALNGIVVARTDWTTRQLTAGDRVVVIQAAQGG